MTTQPMRDLIVVIPGILGSVLEREGKEVWGLSGQVMINNLLSLGRNIQHLALPQGIGDQEPNDGVNVTGLMPDLHISKCGNFPSFVFSPKYGLIADVARNKPSRSRFNPVRIRTLSQNLSFFAKGSSCRPAHRFKGKYFDDFPEFLQRFPCSQETLSAPL
jgi:hypothetical protein